MGILNLKNILEVGKILMVYFFSTLSYMVACSLLIKNEFILEESRYYLGALIVFTLTFLLLIRLFKVRVKSVFIFLGVISFLMIIVMLNMDFFFSIYNGSTPNEGMFPFLFFIAFYTTIPFLGIIYSVVGFGVEKLVYIAITVYMVIMFLLSYLVIEFEKIRIRRMFKI